MGRPPNPLIVEYFRRGPKLKDKSNRYEHTCRKCGILDKTGRPEKLVDHLVKCSHLDYDQRQEILARHLNHRSGIRNGEDGMSSRSPTPPAYAGLEGLAEAARRVSAHEPAIISPTPPYASLAIDPNIGYATTQFYLPPPATQPRTVGCALDGTKDDDMPTIQETTSQEIYDHYTIVDDLDEAAGDTNMNIPHVPILFPRPATKSPLPAALSASTIIRPATPSHNDLNTDINGHLVSASTLSGSTLATSLAPAHATTQLSSPPAAAASGPAIEPSNTDHSSPVGASLNTDSEDSPKAARPKRTRKLQPEQRERTARMRQRGACIRCRLLKKPCSGDDPCQQCQSVHNPRTWKHPCQRVKLHEEISLYSTGLQNALSQRQMRDLLNSHTTVEDQNEISVRISLGSHESYVSFKARRFKPKSQDTTSSPGDEVITIDPQPTVITQMAPKMKRYVKEEYAELLNHEVSPLLRSTLRLAKRVAADKSDEIISSTLELWATTLLLTDDSEPLGMTLETHHPSEMGTFSLTKESHPYSYDMIRSQLRAAIESNAAAHLPKLLIKLETRLQKPKGRLFETYLACLLLLNCAERMCWLIRQWQVPGLLTRPWPLQKEQPGQLVQQGETMASVLHMVMDMRNVLPKPFADGTGTLLAPPGSSEDAKAWFNEIDVSSMLLKTWEERPFLAGDLRSMDGRFWARTLSVDDRNDGLV